MQELAATGKPFSKKGIYEELAGRFGRSAKAFEYRMQNISAVLDGMGQKWLPGLPPAANVGDRNSSKLKKLLIPVPAYWAKLPLMRHWLIGAAQKQSKVTYGALMAAFDIDRFSLRAAMGRLGHEARNRGEPIITAMVVSANTGKCSGGIEKEFGIADDEAERLRLYRYWSNRIEPAPQEIDLEDDSLAARAARFARAKVRPEQAKFRRNVFIMCGGKCVITGCDAARALDAAHRKGRSWQKGHNKASDGYLMRKDLHALYDGGHLIIGADGVLQVDAIAARNYPELLRRRIQWAGFKKI
jgi:hypothetical protein